MMGKHIYNFRFVGDDGYEYSKHMSLFSRRESLVEFVRTLTHYFNLNDSQLIEIVADCASRQGIGNSEIVYEDVEQTFSGQKHGVLTVTIECKAIEDALQMTFSEPD